MRYTLLMKTRTKTNNQFTAMRKVTVLLISILTLSVTIANAQDAVAPEPVRTNRNGQDQVQNIQDEDYDLTSLSDGQILPVFPAPPCQDGEHYFGIQLLYDFSDLNTSDSWNVTVNVSFLDQGVAQWNGDLSLDLATQTITDTRFHPDLLTCSDDYEIRINSISSTGTLPAAAIMLRFKLFQIRETAFNKSNELSIAVSQSSQPEDILLAWSGVQPGAWEYDVEWVYLNEHETSYDKNVYTAFANKEAVRVTTSSLHYILKHFYPDGQLWFRIREVGYRPEYPGYRYLGYWNYVSTPYECTNPNPDYNWQQVNTYAEEGKNKKVLSYFDGSLRNRQTLTNLSTEQQSLVAESYYDYEGRPVVNVLPVPAGDNVLTYHNGFNDFETRDSEVAANISDRRKKFHYDNGFLLNSTLDQTTGAGKYYSANNDMGGIHHDFLPDANGFAYRQTVYTNDGRQWPVVQSGVGETFQTDFGKTTRYFYGQAAPAELIRLFGSNVGNAPHYKKNAVVDPNGQASISYIDQEGRTIATALAGENPDELEPLPSLNEIPEDQVSVSLTEKNKVVDHTKVIDHKILNVAPATGYTFTYNLNALGSAVDVFGCQTCTFDLKIEITDPNGLAVDLSSQPGNETTNGTAYIRQNITAADCNTPVSVNDITLDLTFDEVGDYTVTKTLVANDITLEEMRSEVIQLTEVQDKFTEIETTIVIDESDCDVCTDCPENAGFIEDAITNIADFDCRNIRMEIIQDIRNDVGDQNYDPTSEEIEDHENYCAYSLCVKNTESDEFEKRLTMAEPWSGIYGDLLTNDPFFADGGGLSGDGLLSTVQTRLSAILFKIPYDNDGNGTEDGVNTFVGNWNNVNDVGWDGNDFLDYYGNPDFLIDENGNLDPVNGYHILYYDLQEQYANGFLTEEEYDERVEQQRWTYYVNFYLEAKRKTKINDSEYADCPKALETLGVTDELPKDPDEIRDLGEDDFVYTPVSDIELNTTISQIEANCDIELSDYDKNVIKTNLEIYFNENIYRLFRFILRDDLAVSQNLQVIQSILEKPEYGCGLDGIVVDDPQECLEERDIPIDGEIWDPQPIPISEGDNDQVVATLAPKPDVMAISMELNGTSTNEARNTGTRLLSGDGIVDKSFAGKTAENQVDPVLKQIEEEILAEIHSERTQKQVSDQQSLQSGGYMMSAPSNPPTPVELPSDQRDALIAFYNAMDGDNWTNIPEEQKWKQNGVFTDDISTWFGVTLDGQGNVIELILINVGMSGVIPDELYSLSKLQEIRLVGPNLQGPISHLIGDLNDLFRIHIVSEQLNSKIPEQIGALTNLEFIYMPSSNIYGSIPESIGNCKKLKGIALWDNNISGELPEELFAINSLETIWLEINEISGTIPPSITDLPKLDVVFLADNRLSGFLPEGLEEMESLRVFQVNDNNIQGEIPSTYSQLILYDFKCSNNNLSGEIPFNESTFEEISNKYGQYNYVTLSGNNYVFKNLLPVLKDYESVFGENSNNLRYSPQNPIDIETAQYALGGEPFTMSTEIDRDTDPPSLYQWFKDGVAITTESADNHTLTIDNFTQDDAGHYHYTITNPAAPDLTLVSHVRTVYYKAQCNDVPNAQFLGKDECGPIANNQNINAGCFDGWSAATGTPNKSGEGFFIWAYPDFSSSEALMGKLVQELLPGNEYELYLEYKVYNDGTTYTTDVSHAYVELSKSRQFRNAVGSIVTVQEPDDYVPEITTTSMMRMQQDTTEEAGGSMFRTLAYTMPGAVSPDTVILEDGSKTTKVWYGTELTNTDQYIPIKIRFTPTDTSRYIYFSLIPNSNELHQAVQIRHMDLRFRGCNRGGGGGPGGPGGPGEPVTGLPDNIDLCLEYNLDNDINRALSFDLDFDLLRQQCIADLEIERQTRIEYEKEEVVREYMSAYYQQFTTNCLDATTESFGYTYQPKEYHYTLYYYDQAGNLVQTVPPKGVNPLTPQQVDDFLAGNTVEPGHTLITRYQYNAINQLVEQHTPDAGASQFWYDSKGQLRLSQNAKQAANGWHSYTRYDAEGRIVEVGELRDAIQTEILDSLDSYTFPIRSDYELADITHTYYDEGYSDMENVLAGFAQENLRRRVSYVQVYDTEAATPVSTWYSYDAHGNVKTLLQDVQGLVKRTDYVYDLVSGNVNYVMYQYGEADQFIHRYTYDADNRITEVHTSHDGFIWDKEAEYIYYPHGPLARIEVGEHNVQGVDYFYTLQGWLKGINMPYDGDPGGDGYNQSLIGGDEYAVTLGYYDGDYTPIGNTINMPATRDQMWQRYSDTYGAAKGSGLYNGNIAWMITDLKEAGRQQNDAANSMQAMLYSYDQLNRIMAARSLTDYTVGSGFDMRATAEMSYDVNYTYDPNGNLLTLQRNDAYGNRMDDFVYTYQAGTNRLTALNDTPGAQEVFESKTYTGNPLVADGKIYRHITAQGGATVPAGNQAKLEATETVTLGPGFTAEAGSDFEAAVVAPALHEDESGTFTYDEIGNLIANESAGVTYIQWTVHGKVRSVTKEDGSTVQFVYDGSGNRVAKRVSTGGTTTTTHYVRDASGNVMAVYNDTELAEQPIYGSSRLGMYTGGAAAGRRTLGYKKYELSNHLGNVLAVVGDRKYIKENFDPNSPVAAPTELWAYNSNADVQSANDYYPFGLTMSGRSVSTESYRYGFNGKEKDVDGAEGMWYIYAKTGVYGPTTAKIVNGTEDGVKATVLGTWDFVTNSAWKAETWRQTGLFLEEVVLSSSPYSSIYNPNTPRLDAAVQGFEDDVINGDAYTRSKFASGLTTDILLGFAGDKGLSKIKALAASTKFVRGSWVTESTVGWSAAAKSYQEFVTGIKAGNALDVNGVRFDGIRGKTLLEAKSSYANFVNKNGEFYSWFKGKDSLLDQAQRQIDAADGASIEWNFSSQKSLDATKKLLNDNGIEGIDFKYNPQE
jgi:YD repeat-containing protein